MHLLPSPMYPLLTSNKELATLPYGLCSCLTSQLDPGVVLPGYGCKVPAPLELLSKCSFTNWLTDLKNMFLNFQLLWTPTINDRFLLSLLLESVSLLNCEFTSFPFFPLPPFRSPPYLSCPVPLPAKPLPFIRHFLLFLSSPKFLHYGKRTLLSASLENSEFSFKSSK